MYKTKMAKEIKDGDYLKFQQFEGTVLADPIVHEDTGCVTFPLHILGEKDFVDMELLKNLQVHYREEAKVETDNNGQLMSHKFVVPIEDYNAGMATAAQDKVAFEILKATGIDIKSKDSFKTHYIEEMREFTDEKFRRIGPLAATYYLIRVQILKIPEGV